MSCCPPVLLSSCLVVLLSCCRLSCCRLSCYRCRCPHMRALVSRVPHDVCRTMCVPVMTTSEQHRMGLPIHCGAPCVWMLMVGMCVCGAGRCAARAQGACRLDANGWHGHGPACRRSVWCRLKRLAACACCMCALHSGALPVCCISSYLKHLKLHLKQRNSNNEQRARLPTLSCHR